MYLHRLYVNHKGNMSWINSLSRTHTHLQPGRVFVHVNTWTTEPDSNKESWMREGRREEQSRWPSADRLRDWERGVFSEGRGLVLLLLRGPRCQNGVAGVPKEPRSYGVSVPTVLIPSPGLLSFLFFNFSNAIKCDTNCLPSVSATTWKRKGGGKNRHTSQDLGTK